MTAEDTSVVAIVLTYNAPDSLIRCVEAIRSQTRKAQGVVVVDNASVRPAAEVLNEAGLDSPSVTVLRQHENSGPAGGHAAGLRALLRMDNDVGWVMDDDCVPAPDCLELLLATGRRQVGPMFVFPQWVQPGGAVTQYPAWCGFLIDRSIVETVGLPLEELFWWAEDTEYLFWRIPRAGFPIVHSPAVVEHLPVRQVHGNPPWKYYYEARNDVFFHLHVKRNVRRLPKKIGLLVARAVIREHRRRLPRLGMIARGVADGTLRRLGKRVEVAPDWAAQR